MTEGQFEHDSPDRRGRAGLNGDVALPVAIVSLVFGIIGLTQPTLAWVALALGIVAGVLSGRSVAARSSALVGSIMGLVGVLSSFIG